MTSNLAVLIVVFFAHTIALLTTILRLIHRKQRNGLWWDDRWAFVALLFDTSVWIFYIILNVGPGSQHPSQSIRMFLQFGIMYSYTTALWLARISIAVTIVRLLNPGRFRTGAKIVAIIFGLFWLVLVLQKLFRCGVNTLALSSCPIPPTTGYLELATDILGDTWLVLAPAYMLWIMKISQIHRLLVFGIFSCSALTIGASIAHTYLILVQSSTWITLSAHLQSGVSIAVCNLLVLVTYIYRSFFNVERNAVIPAHYTETRQSRPPTTRTPGIPSNSPAAPSAGVESEPNGITMVTLTEIESDFGNSMHTSFPGDGNDSLASSDIIQVKSSPSGKLIGRTFDINAHTPLSTV